jgi:hypothetical protein
MPDASRQEINKVNDLEILNGIRRGLKRATSQGYYDSKRAKKGMALFHKFSTILD